MNIVVNLNYPIKDGSEVVFRSPVDCSQITGLKLYYPAEDGTAASVEFALADAHGNNVGDIDHLFAENVVVKVILDVTSGMAFVQNADTNAYLEARFAEIEGSYTRTLAAEDFAAGKVSGTGAYDPSTKNLVTTPSLIECTKDSPYSVTKKGDSTCNVYYYRPDGSYISNSKVNLTGSTDNVFDHYNGTEEVGYVRFLINYQGNSSAFASVGEVVSQFTFSRNYSDPIARKSDIATIAKKDEVDYYSSVNRIPTRSDYDANGLEISTTDEQGKYVINGKSTLSKALSVALYDDLHNIPANILRGHSYKIGKRFPSGVNMTVYESTDGENTSRLGTVTGKNSADIKVSENAVGMRIVLTIGHEYTFINDVIETELISVESGKYWAEKNHPYVPTPPPMLTIIDDDGYLGFLNHLMPIVTGNWTDLETDDVDDKDKFPRDTAGNLKVTPMPVPIASAVPIADVEVVDAKGNRANVSMTWAEIESCAVNGAEILSHTYNNIGREHVEGDKMTVEQIVYDYRRAQAHLRHHGIHCDGLVFVKDSSSHEGCITACKQVYKYGFKADSEHVNYKGTIDRYGIHRFGATPEYYDYERNKAGQKVWDVQKYDTIDGVQVLVDVEDQPVDYDGNWLNEHNDIIGFRVQPTGDKNVITDIKDANGIVIGRGNKPEEVPMGHNLASLQSMIDKIVPGTTVAAGDTGWLVWMIHTSINKVKEPQAIILAQAIDYAITKGVQIVSTEYGVRTYCD